MIQIELPSVTPFRSPERRGRIFYNPLSEVRSKTKWLIRQQYDARPTDSPIRALIIYTIAIPKGTSKKKRAELLGKRCLKKIDLDNLQKFLFDCLKELVFVDDSQIWYCTAMKFWGENDRTLVFLWPDQTD